MSNLTQATKLPKAAAEKPARKESEFRRVMGLLGRFIARQRAPFILAFVMLLVEVLSDLGTKYTVPYLLDYLKGGKPDPFTALGLPWSLDLIGTVVFLLAGFVILSMINSSSDSASEIFLARGGRQLGLNMRVGLYSHLQRLSLAFYNQQRTGDLMTRVTGDVAAVEDFVVTSLSDMVGGVLLLIGSLAFLFWADVRIGLLAFMVVPPLALVSNYFSGRVKTTAKKVRAREGELAAAAQEMLTSIRVIQTYGRGADQAKRFAAQSNKTMQVALEAARIQALFSFVIKTMESLATIAVIGVGVWLISGNLIQLGELVLFYNLIDGMFKPTKKIIKEWNSVGKVYASVERIAELLDRKPAVQDLPGAAVAPRFVGTIEYQHVSFAYQVEPEAGGQPEAPRLALRDISFTISPGEVVALVGGSGAGKSTVVQLLPRLYDPHAGKILVDGHDLREYTLDSLRAQMSMVLQEAILFSGTVAENIAYGRDNATREEIIAAAIQANAHEFIDLLPDGYDTMLGERAGNLSGGQRQRIAIARAFIRNTPILILDEPTTGLDAESTDLVLTALRELMRGKATIIISHDLNLIRQADKILVVKQGEIAQVGTHKELLKHGGLYADLYHKQFGQAVEEQGGPAAAAPAPAQPAPADEDEDGVALPPKVFQTLIGRALPAPVSQKAFQTLMMQAIPQSALPPAQAPAAASPAPAASKPAAASAQPLASAAPEAPATPPVSKPAPTPVQQPAPVASAPAASAAPLASKPAAAAPARAAEQPKPRPAIFETTVMHTIPADIPAAPRQEPARALAPAEAGPRLSGAELDLRNSDVVRKELPGLASAFDAEAMRGYLQSALFGKARPRYSIAKCTPGKAIYLGDACALRYELVVQDSVTGQVLQPLVVGRVFGDQLAGAVYLRDKLAPLAELMRGRPEVEPFASTVAMIEPLNMVVHVFPIDGELPTLVGATDRTRMLGMFAEMLPEALAGQVTLQDCRMVPVNYARRFRCVLRYEIEGVSPGNKLFRREVYGKVATDSQGALIAPVIAALRERLQAARDGFQFDVPRSLGFRSDLHMSLLEGIPGSPRINQLLKARLNGAATDGALTLERALETCARIASTLHTSNIALGRRRTLDDDLAALRRDIRAVQRVSPKLGAQFQAWLERIEMYAEESDPLELRFSHGDYTYAQVIFDGARSGLVDFDTVCQAEPALDLGQFLAYMRVAAHKAGAAAPAGEQLGEGFMNAYIAATGAQLEDAERLRIRTSIYQVVSLMRMALHSWQQIKTARIELALAVLQEAMAALPQLDY